MTVAERRISAEPGAGIEARCLRLNEKAADPGSVAPSIEMRRLARERPEDVLVEIKAAAVNPSDVKAAIGMMPYAVFPRTPGRDYAGVVVEGPSHLVGQEVFGSSGDLGIRRDGTHATHLVVEAEAVVPKRPGLACPSSPRPRAIAGPECRSPARRCWSWASTARSGRRRPRSRPGA